MSKNKEGKKRKIKVWMIVVAIVAVLFVVGIIAMIKAGKQAMDEMTQMMMDGSDDLYVVEKQDLKSEITTSGTVVGTDIVAYTSPVSAKVESVKVEVGQTVNEGEMLLTYNTEDLGDDLVKVQLQAKSEKAAGNATYEAANKAAGKANDAKDKIKTLNSDIETIKGRIKELNDIITIYKQENPSMKEDDSNASGNVTPDVSEGTPDVSEGTPDASEVTTDTSQESENSGNTDSSQKTVDYATYLSATSELSELTESLATKQADVASYQAIVDAADDAKVSGSTATQISVANELADMNVNAAQGTLDDAEAGIVAGKKGIVTSVDITRGAFANETQTMMTIANSDSIGVEFVISKDNLGIIKQGQKARVVVAGKEYTGTVDYVSRVATVDNALSNTSGATIKGRILLDSPDDEICIGVSAKVYLFIGEANQTLAVPYEALNSDVDGDYVFVVNEEGLIERKDVEIGLSTDSYYEITNGIEEGDKIITNVTKDMKQGDVYVPETATGMGAMPVN